MNFPPHIPLTQTHCAAVDCKLLLLLSFVDFESYVSKQIYTLEALVYAFDKWNQEIYLFELGAQNQ